MIKNKNFEIVSISDEHMAIPVGDEATSFHGVIALSESAAFLLEKMEKPLSVEELVDILLEEYEIDRVTAQKDVDSIIRKFVELNLVLDR